MGKKLNKLKGNDGEKLAAKYLKGIGLRILEQNFSTPVGEIDIIATDDKTLIFVEVKTRLGDKFGLPREAVNAYKQRKIAQTASVYIKKFMLFNIAVRFDIVEIFLSDGSINHIPNAFDSYLRY